VTAVDATGAGDTFCGALAAELAGGADLERSVRFAVVAASLSVERAGAVPSIPRRAAVESRLEHED
jgi:ribokinase